MQRRPAEQDDQLEVEGQAVIPLLEQRENGLANGEEEVALIVEKYDNVKLNCPGFVPGLLLLLRSKLQKCRFFGRKITKTRKFLR
ncbi:hypothetical protein ABEV74_19360 [Paenibacillus cisolokensis]|uniref:hypothetical protein n=1 Tax=Paenibacillus cisolokensis TaxID=1658519 RepID=UPI003D293EE6